jgi:hypothetical protein
MSAILLPPMTASNPVSTYLVPMHASAIVASGYTAMDAIAQVCVIAKLAYRTDIHETS